MVAPFVIGSIEPLSFVNGVYNAIEVMGDPLGNVMFYGQGAGAGATASAVVGDLMQIMNSGVCCKAPVFERSESIAPFEAFVCRHYLAFAKESESAVMKVFGNATVINSQECAIITEPMAESELSESLKALGIEPLSHIRELK
jgi:homoserine dehydrogenase